MRAALALAAVAVCATALPAAAAETLPDLTPGHVRCAAPGTSTCQF